MGEARAPLARTLFRGLRGRCPACGRAALFARYLTLAAACPACGERLERFGTADVAPHITVFLVGLIVTPLAVSEAARHGGVGPAMLAFLLVLAGGLALALLPRVKGMLAALLWRAGREM